MAATAMSAPAYNAVAVTLKDSAGHIYFAAAGAAAGTVHHGGGHRRGPDRGDGEQLSTPSPGMSCFLDPIAARADVEGMGLKNTGGYIYLRREQP